MADDRYMPTFDEVMAHHEQLKKWASEPKRQPRTHEEHQQTLTYFGDGKPGPGLKSSRRSPDANF